MKKHVKEEAVANLPTQYGDFKMYGYINDITGEHHLALVKGDLGDRDGCALPGTFGVSDRGCIRIAQM